MTRIETLRNALREIDVTTASTGAVVEACLEVLPDAASDEMSTALRSVAEERQREADGLERYRRCRGAGIRGVIDGQGG